MTIDTLSRADLQEFHDHQRQAYDALKRAGLALDITRGKPSAEQLDLSAELLSLPGDHGYQAGGVDVRNYGGNAGLPQLRSIFAELLNVPVEQLIAGDNASLSLMHDTILWSLVHGNPDSPRPWGAEEKVTFICPSPGYDRHFSICEHYGIDMVAVDMREDGPDMDAVRELVKDPSVKGIWLVPTYSNPTGAVVSEAIAAELAALETAAPDFRIFWDDAYAVHHLTEDRVKSADILGLCASSGHPDRPLIFASTSKITFAGAGVSFFGSSPANIAWYLGHAAVRAIGPDKVNQWRHALFLRNADGVLAHMDRHRAILAPKFAAVDEILSARLGAHGIATWTRPRGGYFVSLDVPDGTAARVVQLAREAGIALTPAGAAFPYGQDPRDRHIRIAPSFPPPEELRTAMEGLCTCVLLAAAEKALA
ncbi:aminotransferase class I/II-fold pyridoxal phosphate-dependent enzyme [uncultured Aeromicrobium sp.]|uniref:aminotransferase class I/II-fold pyridoxal phosphate-dependent enzyme n=1 Tax=uncultured Aeromicrobium sp. TaxID=337820 RepID=UPI0026015F2B|nr:aminotransferase class I/II-fold pyridoxal phosphate-dependent enzyme [uncultured Aeromicrobium sp.]